MIKFDIINNSNLFSICDLPNSRNIFAAMYIADEPSRIDNFFLKKYHFLLVEESTNDILGYFTGGKYEGGTYPQYQLFLRDEEDGVEEIWIDTLSNNFETPDTNLYREDLELLIHLKECEKLGINGIPDEVWNLVDSIPVQVTSAEYFALAREFTLEFPQAGEDFSDVPDIMNFTDVVPGKACETGGEYGFYSHYQKTSIPGWFYYWTSCTCSFDNCGTGWESILQLTHDDLNELREREAEVYAEADKEED